MIITPYGIDERRNIKPFKNCETNILNYELNSLETIIKSMKANSSEYNNVGRIFCKLKDIRNTVKRCSEEQTLDEVELFEIKYFSILAAELKNIIDKLHLDIEEFNLDSLDKIICILNPQATKIPTFYVYDDYSNTLKSIREKKRKKEKEIFAAETDVRLSELKQKRLDLVIEEEEEELRVRRKLILQISKEIEFINHNIKAIGRLCLLYTSDAADE